MAEKEISVSELATMINVNQATLYRRLDDGEKFSIKEAKEIAKVLELTAKELNEIFFSEIVADMQQQ
ncbi:MAG: helix-turn-helix transcriptional regulator [Ezakiella sp.]|nr:helix-turn-helix transcriptional regulator [Ezakiella sp.]